MLLSESKAFIFQCFMLIMFVQSWSSLDQM